jgi:tetratricopeptide (TPR) repeat protein
MNKRQEAEQTWVKAIRLRPSYFEAVEHYVGLLCGEQRAKEAVELIDFVETSLRCVRASDGLNTPDRPSDNSSLASRPSSMVDDAEKYHFDVDGEPSFSVSPELPGADEPGFGSSGYAIPGSENGRMLALIHAKGNMLYALGDNAGAAKAFENAVLIGAGRRSDDIAGLVKHILNVVAQDFARSFPGSHIDPKSSDPILLPPDKALQTARLCFPHNGDLPGLKYVSGAVHNGMARKAAIATTSNSLLSLAKIFQDGMNTNSPITGSPRASSRVREILALYYLSLALQPSPSTANNVGILLASVQNAATIPQSAVPPAGQNGFHNVPGIVPGSGIALALAYYNYGLNLDNRHAHLYTNLGSLLKDIGQLMAAIKMYEQAVNCDPTFDIALANLANAVKDQGHIADAITYYKRAVDASPDFAEAVCGLANALNSVCNWIGRGGIAEGGGQRDKWHVDATGMFLDGRASGTISSGWLKRVVDIVERQLREGEDWGKGVLDSGVMEDMLKQLSWASPSAQLGDEEGPSLRSTLMSWKGKKWEGVRIVRLVERATRMVSRQWYLDMHIQNQKRPASSYRRPQLPALLTVPTAPTVLPFHTFTCPMSAKQIRLISQRNGLRISCSTLRSPWLPSTVYAPPAPPNPCLKVGYVSSDFNNHPLAHLMQSVFGLHNTKRVKAYCYATTQSDNSIHRAQIEREAPVFYDASSWSADRLVNQIVADGIHILVNLNGYTRGARNEVFAARPAPIQMSFMGFAGTLGAEWCDYLLADDTAVPPDTLRPWRGNVNLDDQAKDGNSGDDENEDWVYGENIIFCRDTFFCCDHRQSAPDSKGRQLNWDEEQGRRWTMRKELFPDLADDAIILGNFNQLYKVRLTLTPTD